MMKDAAVRAVAAADDYLAALSRYQQGDDGPGDPGKIAGGPEAHRFFQAIAGQPREVGNAAAKRLALGVGSIADPLAAVARGEGFAEAGMSYNVGWHYEYWWGLHPAGAAQQLNLHPLVAGMIAVEAVVDRLPEFRGQAILLMRPKLLDSRSCDINFFAPLHDALRSRVNVLRILPAAEVDSLC
jgi:hypothetical protein